VIEKCPNCGGLVKPFRVKLRPEFVARHYPQYTGAAVQADMAACDDCNLIIPLTKPGELPQVYVNGKMQDR